jgi:Na+-transporting NADH:ubiquinone oxidoreductase subunit A
VSGTGAATPRIVDTILGAPLSHIVGDTVPGSNRWILGSVLTGATRAPESPAGFLTRGVHVLPEAVQREVLGWAMPGFGRWSAQRLFPAGFGGSARYDIRPGVWGGERAIVPVGFYEKVVATPDIEPTFLFRSLFAGDSEDAVRLGMLDISLEEAALCTYVCPAKLEFDVLLRNSLDAYAKEIG